MKINECKKSFFKRSSKVFAVGIVGVVLSSTNLMASKTAAVEEIFKSGADKVIGLFVEKGVPKEATPELKSSLEIALKNIPDLASIGPQAKALLDKPSDKITQEEMATLVDLIFKKAHDSVPGAIMVDPCSMGKCKLFDQVGIHGLLTYSDKAATSLAKAFPTGKADYVTSIKKLAQSKKVQEILGKKLSITSSDALALIPESDLKVLYYALYILTSGTEEEKRLMSVVFRLSADEKGVIDVSANSLYKILPGMPQESMGRWTSFFEKIVDEKPIKEIDGEKYQGRNGNIVAALKNKVKEKNDPELNGLYDQLVKRCDDGRPCFGICFR